MGIEQPFNEEQPVSSVENSENKVTTRAEFESFFESVRGFKEKEEALKFAEDLRTKISERASDLLLGYISGDMTEGDVKDYLDKKWLPEG